MKFAAVLIFVLLFSALAQGFDPTLRMRVQVPPVPTLNITNNATTGLQVGDVFFTSVGAGNWNLGAGAFYNGMWTANFSGTPYLLSHGVGDGIRFWFGPHMEPGQGVPWTTELHVNSTGAGVRTHVRPMGTVSGAQVWNGVPTIRQVEEVWLCNGCAVPVGRSGMVIVTETWYWGVTCVWVIGGSGWAWRMGQSRTDGAFCADGNGSGGGQFGIGWTGDWGHQYLWNYIGADSVYNIMMLQTRDGL